MRPTLTWSTILTETGETTAVQIFSPFRSFWPMMTNIGEAKANEVSHVTLRSFLVRLLDMMLLALNGWQIAK